jgi:hypothetical protein
MFGLDSSLCGNRVSEASGDWRTRVRGDVMLLRRNEVTIGYKVRRTVARDAMNASALC